MPEYPASGRPPPAVAAPSADPSSWLERAAGAGLRFRTKGRTPPLEFVPLNGLYDERYAVYLRIAPDATAAPALAPIANG